MKRFSLSLFVLSGFVLPSVVGATDTNFGVQGGDTPQTTQYTTVSVPAGFQAYSAEGQANYQSATNFFGGADWVVDGISVTVCIYGNDVPILCDEGSSSASISIPSTGTPYQNYHSASLYAQYYCTAQLSGGGNPINCTSGYGGGVTFYTLSAFARTVSIDSMSAPISADLGQSFSVYVLASEDFDGNSVSSSANISCGSIQSGSYSGGYNRLVSCVGTSVANGSVTFTAKGPIQPGVSQNIRTVTQTRNINIVSSGGSGDPPPPPPPNNYTLTVSKSGTGGGTVTSAPSGINCGSTCAVNYVNGTSVTLTAAAGSGSTFAGWSGSGCSGTGNCTVSMTQARSVTATFNTAACADCAQFISQFVNGVNASNYASPASITVTPGQVIPVSITFKNTGTNTWTCCEEWPSWHPQYGQASQGYKLGDWGVAVGQPAINPSRVPVSGSIAPGQTYTFNFNITVSSTLGTYTFTRRPIREWVGWFGDSTPYANIVVSAAQTLTVTKAGTGTGTVVSTSPTSPSINCGSTCSGSYPNGSSITLSATPASGSVFAGWSGACTGTGNCTVSMTQARSVTATFNTIAPSIISTSISPNPASANAATQHTVTVVASHPLGGSSINYQYALINYNHADNPKPYRGYMVWGVGNWGSSHKDTTVCTGGGQGSLLVTGYEVYGSKYLELDGCTTSISGTNRTVTFTVRFNSTNSGAGTVNETAAFTTPTTGNIISGYARDNNSINSGWVPGATFSLASLTNNSSCVSHNIPTTMTAGQNFAATMTFRNTGTKVWTFNSSSNHYFALNPYPGVSTSLTPKDIVNQTGTTNPGQDRTVNFTLTAPSTAGNYTGTYLMYDASGSGFFGAACGQATVTVSAPAFNYTLSSSGASNVTKTSGTANVQNTITKNLTAGAGQAVTLAVTGLPSGVSVQSITNQGCTLPCGSSVITLAVSPSAPTGAHTITVTGSPLNRTTTFTLNISGNPMSVSCSANPSTVLVGQSVTWTANVSGGTGPYTYSWSGSEGLTGTAASVQKSYSTIGQKTATVAVRDADYPSTAEATCNPAGTAQVYFNPIFEEF